jgi:peroxiredoxin
MRHFALILIVLSIGVGALLAFERREPRVDAPEVGYTLLDGTRATSSQWRGGVTVVNFWATTCAICVKEMPSLVATHLKYRDAGLQTVAVAMKHDPPASVVRFAEQRRLPFGVAIDNTGEIARAFGNVFATPTTFVIDRQGRIVKRFRGEPDLAALHRLIERLLSEA